jgi:hypothetical protein
MARQLSCCQEWCIAEVGTGFGVGTEPVAGTDCCCYLCFQDDCRDMRALLTAAASAVVHMNSGLADSLCHLRNNSAFRFHYWRQHSVEPTQMNIAENYHEFALHSEADSGCW